MSHTRSATRVRSVPVLAGLVCAVLAAGVFGCASEPAEDVVAAMDGWSLTEDELRAAYDDFHGEGAYLAATPEERAEHARLLLDKEILLSLAREACPEPDSQRARRLRVQQEKLVVEGLAERKKADFQVSPEEARRVVTQLSRDMVVRRVGIREAQRAAVQARVEDGNDFESIAREYGAGDIEEAVFQFDQLPVEAIRELFLREEPAPSVQGPMNTRAGMFLFEIQRFEPWSDPDPARLQAARAAIEPLVFVPRNTAWAESLQAVAELTFHSENFGAVGAVVGAYWDSLETARQRGEPFQVSRVRAPLWRVDETVGDLPLYDLWGETHSVRDFVRSLDHVDVEYWPKGPGREKIASAIQHRASRQLFYDHAVRSGYTETEAFQSAFEKVRERELLEQYRFRHLQPSLQITEEDLRAEYEDHPDRYRSPDQIAYGALMFAPDQEELAQSTLDALRGGDALLWYEIGPARAQEDPRIQFQPDTGLLDAATAPAPAWEPIHERARMMEVGEISDVLASQHGFVIVRTNQKVEGRRLEFEEARAAARRNVATRRVDEEIDRQVVEARAETNARVFTERLGILDTGS